ncbi:MAG TPA: ATP-binding cassette domain-containing protein [Polyangiaceae bacterium]|nr:ATP-binding cassette domain-containing protein [Polyangiaceae bacterium]
MIAVPRSLDDALAPRGERSSAYRRAVLRLIFGESRAVRRIFLAALAEGALATAGAWFGSAAIDHALPSGALGILLVLASGLVLTSAYAALLTWIHQATSIALQRSLEVRCLRGVMQRLLGARYERLSQGTFGDTSETMAAAGATAKLVVKVSVALATFGLRAICSIAALSFWFPGLAILALGLAATTCSGVLWLTRQEVMWSEQVLNASSRRHDAFHSMLRSVATLRSFGITDRLIDGWGKLLGRHASASSAQNRVTTARAVVVESGQQLANLLAMGWVAREALEHTASIGQVLGAAMLMTSFMSAATELCQIWFGLRSMDPHFGRVDRVLGAAPENAPSPSLDSGAPPVEAGDELRLDGVWFRYSAEAPWVLRDFSCRFATGKVTRFQAPSGWGKSTALRLLAGLLRPERGSASCLGRDPYVHRGLVAYLPQGAALLEASIAENLRVLSNAPTARIQQISKLTGLDHLLERLPMGIETLLSSGGRNLSSGQRQLVLLTAACANPRPVVLLDEPTSQLDAASKARIQWRALASGRVFVIVEHISRA